jgi:hypothetical protein
MSKHSEYQNKLLEIGKKLGYEVKKLFSRDAQGDVTWFVKMDKKIASKGILPLVSFEILSSELLKGMRGSIATLQRISPALGVLVVLEDEYARKAKDFKTYNETTYPKYIKEKAEEYARGVEFTCRIEVWGQKEVDELYNRLVTISNQ